MNKIYRVIWSKAHNTWVAVSEITKAQGKSSHSSVVSVSTIEGGQQEQIHTSGGLLKRSLIAIAVSVVFLQGNSAFAAFAAGGSATNVVSSTNSGTATSQGSVSAGAQGIAIGAGAGSSAVASDTATISIGNASSAQGTTGGMVRKDFRKHLVRMLMLGQMAQLQWVLARMRVIRQLMLGRVRQQ